MFNVCADEIGFVENETIQIRVLENCPALRAPKAGISVDRSINSLIIIRRWLAEHLSPRCFVNSHC